MSNIKLSNKVFGTRMLLISSVLFLLFFVCTVMLFEVFGSSCKAFILLSIMGCELSLGFIFAGDKIRKIKDN